MPEPLMWLLIVADAWVVASDASGVAKGFCFVGGVLLAAALIGRHLSGGN